MANQPIRPVLASAISKSTAGLIFRSAEDLKALPQTKGLVDIQKIQVYSDSMKFSKIMTLATSQLARRLTLVFMGNLFAAGLGFLAVLIISRELTVSDFGLFNMAISVILIASHLASLGMDTGMIKFASSYLGVKKTAEATQVLRLTLLVRVITSFILAAIIFNTAELLSTKVFHYPSLTPLLKLAAFGILAISTLNYLKSALYAYQLFKRAVILQLLVDFSKFFTVIILILSLGMDTLAAVATFAFIPLLGVLLGLGQLRRKLFSEREPIQNLFRQLFSYSKWVFAGNACRLILPYIGILMLAKMLNSKTVGIYGLALGLTYIFPILIYSSNSVLLPEISRFREMEQFEKYIKGSLKISFSIGMMIIPFLFFSHKIIPFFFGSRYLDSVPIFNWLLLGYIALMINNPIRMALYSMNKPHLLAMVDVLKLTAMVIGCYLLIPFFGVLAPAILALIVNVSALGFCSIYVFKQIRSGYSFSG